MTKYFREIRTFDELRKAYLKLSKQFHPDLNPAEEEQKFRAIFQELNNEYEKLSKILKSEDSMKEKFGEKMEGYENAVDEMLMKIVEILMKYDCTIEVVGIYIWVSNTKREDKSIYNELGLKWHGNRKMWYFTPLPVKSTYAKNMSFDEIRSKYGSVSFEGKQKHFAQLNH